MDKRSLGQPVSGSSIPEIVAGLSPIFSGEVSIEVVPASGASRPGRGGMDFHVGLAWKGERFEFAAEAKSGNTPRILEEALRQAQREARETGLLPMVIVPFLGEKRLERLLEEGVSGLDLCGNGIVIVPGRMLLRRSGEPNRYPESRPARFAYRGATSLVPRVFLRRTEYGSVGQIKEEIEAAGASVALSTVSKALARMAEDLIIDRSAKRISLLQPDKLIDQLAESFVAPRAERIERAKVSAPMAELFRLAGDPVPTGERAVRVGGTRLVVSGLSSQYRYAAGLRADAPTLFCNDLSEFRRRAAGVWRPTDRFADMTVIETPDQTPFFDAQRDKDGVIYASPVQSYLELVSGNEKRDREMAVSVRDRILRDIGR